MDLEDPYYLAHCRNAVDGQQYRCILSYDNGVARNVLRGTNVAREDVDESQKRSGAEQVLFWKQLRFSSLGGTLVEQGSLRLNSL